MSSDIIGDKNNTIIKSVLAESNKVIIAWGTPPNGLKREFNKGINNILKLLQNQNVFYVDCISKKGIYRLHGQV